MPYIKQKERGKYGQIENAIKVLPQIDEKGDLEYLVFMLMMKYMQTRDQRYSMLHDCTYAVQHCSDEFRRRFLDLREDYAKETNGDIEV